ncbi:hypothetical protein [Bartonella sp. HY761]|uniref:hypothetical protein n=1 Tax=Bartonella sp. HY761 TaxID=2979330 RepID=UPI00220F3A3D|nr:hypothetical protein [Bartonella sp. HY761]UXN06802.1 hypothetical protein N6A79_01965 [Bartonella sp. HY761]
MKNCLWYPIDAFHSLHEYARFCNWLQLQIAEGMVEEITVKENSTRLPLYQQRTIMINLIIRIQMVIITTTETMVQE